MVKKERGKRERNKDREKGKERGREKERERDRERERERNRKSVCIMQTIASECRVCSYSLSSLALSTLSIITLIVSAMISRDLCIKSYRIMIVSVFTEKGKEIRER